MTNLKCLTIFSVFLTCVLCSYCKKEAEKPEKPENDEFCRYVADQDFEATGPFIDEFLKTLEKNKPEENLNKLRAWLEAKECIGTVTIKCNSCILTYPPVSELNVEFISDTQIINMILDIRMTETLSFDMYH